MFLTIFLEKIKILPINIENGLRNMLRLVGRTRPNLIIKEKEMSEADKDLGGITATAEILEISTQPVVLEPPISARNLLQIKELKPSDVRIGTKTLSDLAWLRPLINLDFPAVSGKKK